MKPMIAFGFALSLLVAVSLWAGEPSGGNPDPFSAALAEIGLTRETLTFDYADMANYGGDKYALPLFYTLHSNPFKVEHYAKAFRE